MVLVAARHVGRAGVRAARPHPAGRGPRGARAVGPAVVETVHNIAMSVVMGGLLLAIGAAPRFADTSRSGPRNSRDQAGSWSTRSPGGVCGSWRPPRGVDGVRCGVLVFTYADVSSGSGFGAVSSHPGRTTHHRGLATGDPRP
ncbi:hypothetical protein QJS66_17770 [Kocuria rhizophila]|nr:hypothetical protein QJS66_17770 [Kocuria rhizophila]